MESQEINDIKELNEKLLAQKSALEVTNKALNLLFKKLEAQNAELLKVDQLKSDFVSTVSHELRTPLAISIEGINLILDGIVGVVSPKQKELLITSRDNLVRLTSIVNDLLDIQKIEAGKMSLKQSLVDVKSVVLKLVESYKIILAKRKQELDLKLPSEDILLYADGDKIIQVLNNLLNNAHKFSPDGGAIHLEVLLNDHEILFCVKDTGPGFSQENKEKLFQKFQQFDRTEGPGIRGTGLGLSISKALVELHGGKIWAEGELNQGAAFYFTLPKHQFYKEKFDRLFDETLASANLKGSDVLLIVMVLVNAQKIREKYGFMALVNMMNLVFSSCSSLLTRPDDIKILYDIHTIYFVLPKTDKVGGRALAHKFQDAVLQCRPEGLKNTSELQFKFGVSVSPTEAQKREELVKKAFLDNAV
ncbi:MAG: HAMP domain-containing histidine kinase [Candidatus Omnitrophica bacterium]|nr:HAMP domain-containing histidine kinase [Candidatus Omnitrophota bacterium]